MASNHSGFAGANAERPVTFASSAKVTSCKDYTWGKYCKKNGGEEHRCAETASHVVHKCKCGWTRR